MAGGKCGRDETLRIEPEPVGDFAPAFTEIGGSVRADQAEEFVGGDRQSVGQIDLPDEAQRMPARRRQFGRRVDGGCSVGCRRLSSGLLGGRGLFGGWPLFGLGDVRCCRLVGDGLDVRRGLMRRFRRDRLFDWDHLGGGLFDRSGRRRLRRVAIDLVQLRLGRCRLRLDSGCDVVEQREFGRRFAQDCEGLVVGLSRCRRGFLWLLIGCGFRIAFQFDGRRRFAGLVVRIWRNRDRLCRSLNCRRSFDSRLGLCGRLDRRLYGHGMLGFKLRI